MSELKSIGWNIDEIENRYPFEKDIYQGFIQIEISKRQNTDNPPPDFFG